MNDLTGRTRYRQGFWGGMILQVEYDNSTGCWCGSHDCPNLRWRDARITDLSPPRAKRPKS